MNDPAVEKTIDLSRQEQFIERSRPEELPGNREVVSSFHVLRKIAEGGLGTVWLARDEKLKRNVAVKELKESQVDSAKAWSRFHREAEITGLLEHPNVVPLYQFGNDRSSEKPFYAMRFVGKRTLANAIDEHRDRVDAGERLELGLHRLLSAYLGVCQAIAYAHSRGVIHRDLKPENVALDNFGQVIVLDWGLAKLVDEGEIANQLATITDQPGGIFRSTVEGDVVGTPLYMAPEQAAGNSEEVDQRTDIYGLGAVLFSILTGVAPHAQSVSNNNAARLEEVLNIVATGDTPRPSDHDPTVPSELESICMKAMAQKPHLRFQSVEELAEEIERWMAGQSSKKADYEAIRTEGRELKTSLQVAVESLERNVQFMSHLPPIQQLVGLEPDEEIKVWRDRLATIFKGLLEANQVYRSVAFCRLTEDEVSEMVRVERHGREATRVRIVPKSRLNTVEATPCARQLVAQKPEDIITLLAHDPLAPDCRRNDVGLVSGVPIFNEKTEEPYGFLLIDYDLERMMRQQLLRSYRAAEIIVAGGNKVLMHSRSGRLVEESTGASIEELAPYFQPAIDALANRMEYLDGHDCETYGVRLPFGLCDGVQILLRRTAP